MKQGIFVVLDTVADQYMTPFFAPSRAYALRSFREAAEDDGHQFHKHPSDYVLYEIGTFEGEKGILAGIVPIKMAIASSFVFNRVELPDTEELL